MNTYTFVIGSMDSFENMDDLVRYTERGGPDFDCEPLWSAFEFDAPESCDDETVTLIGRGLAFTAHWSLDDSLSFVAKGSIDSLKA